MREYWIVNLTDKRVEVHRNPTKSGYRSLANHGRDEALNPEQFPDVAVKVEEILPR